MTSCPESRLPTNNVVKIKHLMDDANLPSLLSSPLTGYVNPREEVYLNTRMYALSEANPYWAFGTAFEAVGGPHLGPTKGWPLASIVRIMTSDDGSGDEIRHELHALLSTTDGLGKLLPPSSDDAFEH